MSWEKTILGKVTDLKRGFDLPKSQRIDGMIPVYSSSGLSGSHNNAAVDGPCVITGRYGTIGEVYYSAEPCWPLNTALYSNEFYGNSPRFVYYLLKTIPWQDYTTASAVPGINRNHVNLCPVAIPDRGTQDSIVAILDSLDEKISLNQRINDYLAAMLVALQRRAADTSPTMEYRADEVFSIHIGKTPPRKQREWFSTDHADNEIWMSIKDMGDTGVYLIDSSEYLTRQAVEKFKIKKCSPGSVLLSFKLTVGRVGIVANEMVTNEAIACFASDDERRLAYLYPLLLTYDYASLGSTSSIATAVNSKMVKAMPLMIPGERALDTFFEQAKPILDLLLSNIRESAALERLRDTLLLKLMSGEIDASKVELSTLPNNHLCDGLSQS